MRGYVVRVTARGASAAALFLALFGLFLVRNGAYLPSTLKVCLRAEPQQVKLPALKGAPLPDGELLLSLDVGRGLTAYRNLRSNFPVALPQLPVRGLRLQSPQAFILESATIRSPRGSIAVPLGSAMARNPNGILAPLPEGAPVSDVVFPDIDLRTKYASPLLITVQALLALSLACGVYRLLGLRARLGKADWRSAARYLFLERGHWIFWVFWAVSAGVLTLWLLAEWPGSLTNDGMDVWMQSITLDFNNWHPYPYAIFILALRQIADTPAAVSIAQILMTASLGSFIFYSLLYLDGRRAILPVAPFFLLFVLSVPVGVSTITCSKDALFSLLVVFWAFFLFYASYRKGRGSPIGFTPASIFVLSFLFIAACLLRHNGIIMLVALPLFLWGARLMPPKRLGQFIAISAFLFAMGYYVVANVLGVHKKTDYQRMEFVHVGNQIAALFAAGGYYSDDYDRDRKTIEKLIFVDDIKKHFVPNTQILWDTGEHDYGRRYYTLSRRERQDIINLYYTRALPNLHIIMAERADTFFSALGFGGYTFFYANAFRSPEYWSSPDFKLLPGFIYSPKSDALNRIADRLIMRASTYRGVRSGAFIYRNLFFPFCCILAAAALYKWIPSTALAALFLMVQMLLLFIAMPGPDFRYMYYVYLSGFFLFPMAVIEALHPRRG